MVSKLSENGIAGLSANGALMVAAMKREHVGTEKKLCLWFTPNGRTV